MNMITELCLNQYLCDLRYVSMFNWFIYSNKSLASRVDTMSSSDNAMLPMKPIHSCQRKPGIICNSWCHERKHAARARSPTDRNTKLTKCFCTDAMMANADGDTIGTTAIAPSVTCYAGCYILGTHPRIVMPILTHKARNVNSTIRCTVRMPFGISDIASTFCLIKKYRCS